MEPQFKVGDKVYNREKSVRGTENFPVIIDKGTEGKVNVVYDKLQDGIIRYEVIFVTGACAIEPAEFFKR